MDAVFDLANTLIRLAVAHPLLAFVVGLLVVLVAVVWELGGQAGIGTAGYRNGR